MHTWRPPNNFHGSPAPPPRAAPRPVHPSAFINPPSYLEEEDADDFALSHSQGEGPVGRSFGSLIPRQQPPLQRKRARTDPLRGHPGTGGGGGGGGAEAVGGGRSTRVQSAKSCPTCTKKVDRVYHCPPAENAVCAACCASLGWDHTNGAAGAEPPSGAAPATGGGFFTALANAQAPLPREHRAPNAAPGPAGEAGGAQQPRRATFGPPLPRLRPAPPSFHDTLSRDLRAAFLASRDDPPGAAAGAPFFADVWFRIDSRVIPAHRFVIAARCPALAALVLSHLQAQPPSEERPVEVGDGVTPGAFASLLEFLYSGDAPSLTGAERSADHPARDCGDGECDVSAAADLLAAASCFAVQPLIALTANHLSARLSASNALPAALLATRLGLSSLRAAAVGALARGVGEKRAAAVAALQGDGVLQDIVREVLQAVAGTDVH